MIPMTMLLEVRTVIGKELRLWFPVIVLWIITFALLVAVLPLVVIAALVTLRRGPGFRLLLLLPVVLRAVFTLSGLRVDIASHGSRTVFISFD